MTPQVSVVIPTKDRWAVVGRAIRCALSQQGVAVEVLVVDDGSAAPAPDGLVGLADPRVRLLRTERGEGVARARNRGLAEARANWVAFLDDDDLWAPGKLAAQLAAVASRGAILAYTGVVLVREDGTVVDVRRATPPETLVGELRTHNVIGGPSPVLASTDELQRLGGYDPRFSVLADWELLLRLAGRGQAAACPELLTAYVVHQSAMHLTAMDRARQELSVLNAEHGRPGSPIGGYEHRLWTAFSYRDAGRRFAAAREFAALGFRHREPYQVGRAAGLLLGEAAMRRVRPRSYAARHTAPAWVAEAMTPV